MPPRVCLVRSLIAWWIVSGWLAQNCTSRSPCSHAGSGESFGKAVIGLSFSGLAALIPYRSSNSVDPTDMVTVSPSAGTTGPRTSLSDGGWPMPRLGGVPPAVRNRALVVIVCSRSARAALSDAIESKAATQVNACLADGPGVSMPDWLRPVERVRRLLGRRAAALPRVGLPPRVRVGVRAADQHAAGQRGAGGASRGALEEIAAAEVHGVNS